MSNHLGKRVILGSIFLVLSIFYTVIFFRQANFGSTMIFNIAHLKSLSNIFTSPINFNYWNHSGSQINLFSPWLTLLPGWLFMNFNVPAGFSVYLTLITFLTFLSSYLYMKKFSTDTLESLLFSVIYTFSFNRFFQVFQTQRLENYLVMIFLPMVYYGAYQFFKGKGWHSLAWGMILIIWTSPYMALGVTLTLLPIIILMLFSKTSHSWSYWGQLSLNLLLALGMTVLATIGFIGPLISNQLKNKFIQKPLQNFDYVKWFQQFKFPLVQQYLLLGIAVLLVLLLFVIFLKSSFSYKVIMVEMIPLTIMLFVDLKFKSIDLSRLTPSLQSILDLFLIIIVTRIIIMVCQEGPAILKLLLMLVAIGGFSFMIYSQAELIQPSKTLADSGKVDYSKFVTNYHDAAINGQNQILINNRKTATSFYTKDNDYWIQYYGPASADMDLPVQNYAGYQIQLNNEAVKTTASKRGTIELRTNPGKNIVEIHTRYDWIGIVSLLINLLGFILLIYLSLKNVAWKSKKIPDNC